MLVIVPDLPPNINGLGDYAYLLANQLKKDDVSLKIDFLIAGNYKYPFDEYDGFKVYNLLDKKASVLYSLLQQIDPILIHLHYVGYGYAKRGAPFWLYFGILKWKQKKGNILITTFHELFANSILPLTSSFWNQWFQKLICKKIYLISKCVITSSESFREVLFKFSPFIDIYVYPVFSNFGELKKCPKIELRDKGLIVLGSKENRLNLYKKYHKELNIICRTFSIVRIYDVGPKFGKLPLLNVPVIELGVLKANQISNLLTKNSFGIISRHSSEQFAKSGIYAAFTAHGNIVIALQANSSKIKDGIIADKHFITMNSQNINLDLISKSAFAWYNNHSLEKQAISYSNLFKF